MQTKQQIQQLLAIAGTRPNKQLGQHFLIDLNLMRLLISHADISSEDVVLEVGPGTGSLTEALTDLAGAVITVEYDKALAQLVAEQFSHAGNLTVISSDILRTKNALADEVLAAIAQAKEKLPGAFKLVANLPYNVSSPVMIILTTQNPAVEQMHVTVQKEVARRMVAQPGTKDYGGLSIFLAATGSTEIVRVLKPEVFWPRPQVESAIVSYHRDPCKVADIADMGMLSGLVNLFMRHRRKTLGATARLGQGQITGVDLLQCLLQADIDPKARAEQLDWRAFVRLANIAFRSGGS